MKKIKLIATIAMFVLGTSILAEEVYEYQSPIGVELRYDENGEVRSIIATGESDFKIGDSKDIRQATQKATMRAKANIAKFLNEEITSSEVVEEITTTTISTDISSQESEGMRDSIEKMTESLHNEANAILKGVVTLKSEVNQKEKIVIVTVGVKEETMKAASKLSDQMKQTDETLAKTKNKIKEEISTESKVKKSAQYDSF